MDKKQTADLVKELRSNGTEAERVLWLKLRNRQLNDIKFRRQQPIGNYVVDFVSFERKIIIEVDGGQHNEDRLSEKDEIRSKWLESRGFQVMRFWNNEVFENLEGVLIKIQEVIDVESPST